MYICCIMLDRPEGFNFSYRRSRRARESRNEIINLPKLSWPSRRTYRQFYGSDLKLIFSPLAQNTPQSRWTMSAVRDILSGVYVVQVVVAREKGGSRRFHYSKIHPDVMYVWRKNGANGESFSSMWLFVWCVIVREEQKTSQQLTRWRKTRSFEVHSLNEFVSGMIGCCTRREHTFNFSWLRVDVEAPFGEIIACC